MFDRPNNSKMILSKLILFFACLFIFTSCKAQINLPENLNEAVLYFQQKWTKTELEKFKNKPEKDAVTELHFGTGMWIRNTWIHGNRNTALTNYFHSLGIYH